MPIGNVQMSDGRVGALPSSNTREPSGLVRPYDGGLGFKDPTVGTTRFSHQPEVQGHAHLQDKIYLVSEALPPAIGVRSIIGTTRTGARGRKHTFHDSSHPHVAGEIASGHGQSLTEFLGQQAKQSPDTRCIAGSNRKRFDWQESYGLSSGVYDPRGKMMNSYNGRSIYANDQYSYPRKKMYEDKPRESRKGPAAHLVQLANGGEVEDLGRRHYEKLNPQRVDDSAALRGKKADFKQPNGEALVATTQSDRNSLGKMGEYSVFDMIGRKRPDPGKWSENQNCLPATATYGPDADKEGNVIDYSVTENGGPFRRPTLYHNDYRLVKPSTYGDVLPPGHSELWPPGTSTSVLAAQQIPRTMNTRNPLASTTTIGVAPEMSVVPGAPAPAPEMETAAGGLGSGRSMPESLGSVARRRGSGGSSTGMMMSGASGDGGGGGGSSRRASADAAADTGAQHPATMGNSGFIYWGANQKSYAKGSGGTHSCATRAGTPPTQNAPAAFAVPRYKATEDGNHRHRNTHTGIFRP